MKALPSLLAIVLVASLAGCQKASPVRPAPPAAAAPADAPVTAAIDWAAARADRGKAAVNATPLRMETVGGDKPNAPPKVPVLLPAGVVQTPGAQTPLLVTTPDGYFATFRTAAYDLIVNGSNQAYTTGVAAKADGKEPSFTPSEAGAQIAFSRYGAAYLIQFECKEADGAPSCVSEDEARQIAANLFVEATQ